MMMSLTYWLSEHPSILTFRWSHTQSHFATWWFLITSISTYLTLSLLLHLSLTHLLRRRRPIPLGPLPAAHSLLMSLISATIFSGLLLSSVAELHDSHWLYRRTRAHTTPLRWLLCFPPGTRPAGRVFFWSYLFYLSRFLRLFRPISTVLRREGLPVFRLFGHTVSIVTAFLWLEFSQSFQVVGILLECLVECVVYLCRFWSEICGGRGVLVLHLRRGGCNGIGAWGFNSVLNGVVLVGFVNFYVKKLRSAGGGGGVNTEVSSSTTSREFERKR
ncbi:hypothetical protein Scep_020698 [Stephania cephalantha]|uniref:Uncharacterized protein n=1 Tax=Stephania cephalantha TaxID=152367 RepID=A0AAP0ID21_9MAGN